VLSQVTRRCRHGSPKALGCVDCEFDRIVWRERFNGGVVTLLAILLGWDLASCGRYVQHDDWACPPPPCTPINHGQTWDCQADDGGVIHYVCDGRYWRGSSATSSDTGSSG